MSDSRQAFERAVIERWSDSYNFERYNICGQMDTQYIDDVLEGMWFGWQANVEATTVIPEGWKLVPVEPTFDMLSEIHLDASFSHHAMTLRYGAMLDAAPEAPGQEKEHG